MIETILSDVGGVLIRNHDTIKDASIRLNMPPEKVRELWNELYIPYGSGKETEAEMWQRFHEAGGNLISTDETFFRTGLESDLVIYWRVIEEMQRLKEAGKELAILSDTNEQHAAALTENGTYAPFDHLFLSHEIGMRKPNPAAFQYVLSQLGISNPATVLFIDDNPHNTAAAAELGFATLHVEDDEDKILAALKEKIAHEDSGAKP